MKSKKVDLNVYEDILRAQLDDYMWSDDIDNVLNICREKYAEIEKLNNSYEKETSKSKKGTKKKKIKKPFDFEAEICSYTENEELRQALRDFADMREQKKKAILTTATSNRLFNKLNRLCDDDKKKISILEKSIINDWQDIWEMNENNKNFNNNTNKNKKVISINTLSLSEDEMEEKLLSNNDLDNF